MTVSSHAALCARLVETVTLPPQLWVDWHGSGQAPAVNHAPGTDRLGRPRGGLWTSPLDHDGSSAYTRRQAAVLGPLDAPHHQRDAWALTPEPALVLVVDDRMGEADVTTLGADDGVDHPGGFWGRVANHCDAVHMTADGARAFWRMPLPDDPHGDTRLRVMHTLEQGGFGCPLDWWEDESVFWTRWRFAAAEHIGTIELPEMPYDTEGIR